MEQHSCLTFTVDCGVMFKGVGVVLAGFILFVGSVYMLLTAVFGRYMALPRRRGRVLRLDDDPIRHLAVRVLVARARDEDQPRAPRARACMGGGLAPASIPAPCTRSSRPTRAARTRSRTRPTRCKPQTSRPRRASSRRTWRTRRTRSSGSGPARLHGAPADTVHGRRPAFRHRRGRHEARGRPSALPRRRPEHARLAALQQRAGVALLADLLDRLGDPVDRAHPAVGSRRTIAQGIPGRRHRAAVVRTGLGRRDDADICSPTCRCSIRARCSSSCLRS